MSKNLKEIRNHVLSISGASAIDYIEEQINERIKELQAKRDKITEKINFIQEENSGDFEFSLEKHKADLFGVYERIAELNRLLGK